MSLYQQGMTLKALLENPDLLNPPKPTSDEKEKKEADANDLDLFPGQGAFLGPQLWDKTLPYDGKDFELEYMDLDEFLQENGIQDELANMPAPPQEGQHSPGGSTGMQSLSPQSSASPPCGDHHSSAASPMAHLQDISNSTPANNMLGSNRSPQSHSQDSSDSGGPVSIVHKAPPAPHTPTSSHGYKSHDAPERNIVKHEVDFLQQDLALASIPASPPDMRRGSLPRLQPTLQENPSSTDASYFPPEYDQGSGEEDFDPCKRAFTEEELRPQPMIKKSKKVFVPSELKDDKYWARRRKNNIAAKRSRDARRIKENQIAMRASFLEKRYQTMSSEIEALQEENKKLRKKLAKYEPSYMSDSS